eukprot:2843412-Karenia_brevis.AAC.1
MSVAATVSSKLGVARSHDGFFCNEWRLTHAAVHLLSDVTVLGTLFNYLSFSALISLDFDALICLDLAALILGSSHLFLPGDQDSIIVVFIIVWEWLICWIGMIC